MIQLHAACIALLLLSNVAYAESDETVIPFFLKNVVLTADDNPSQFSITGELRHFQLKKVPYNVTVPLKLGWQGIELRTANVQDMASETFRSIRCDAIHVDGTPYTNKNLKLYFESSDNAYLAYQFQTIDPEFLDTLNADVPIFILTRPNKSELTDNVYIRKGAATDKKIEIRRGPPASLAWPKQPKPESNAVGAGAEPQGVSHRFRNSDNAR